MSTTVTGNLTLALSALMNKPAAGLSDIQYQPSISFSFKPTAGTANGQVNVCYDKEHTITAGATLNLDLTPLVDALGDSNVVAEICMVALVAGTANDAALEVGGHATAAALLWFKDATDIFKLGAGDLALHTMVGAGWPITATTADLLKILNPGAISNTVRVMIWARNA